MGRPSYEPAYVAPVQEQAVASRDATPSQDDWVRRSSKRPRDVWATNVEPVDPFVANQDKPTETITSHCEFDFLGYSHSKGSITLEQKEGDLVTFIGEFENLQPGLHSLKIHEFGDLEYGCGSLGNVFNPFGMERGHSHDDLTHRRVGDLEHV